METRAQPEESSKSGDSGVWRAIWAMNLPNVAKNFMWRACHNSLPMKDNLLWQKVVSDPNCPICGLEAEMAYHVLWNCQSAWDVWGASELVSKRARYKAQTSFKWWRVFSTTMERKL
jgi:hypothetical protein